MTADRSISDSYIFSTENAPAPHDGKWVSIGDLAVRLKAEMDRTIAAGEEPATATARHR